MARAIFLSRARRPVRARSRRCRSASCSLRRNGAGAMAEPRSYLRDGAAIYKESFAIIRAEADLARFSAEEADVAVRMIHACGQVEAARHIVFGQGLVAAARAALVGGAPIPGDAGMVAHGLPRPPP